MPCLGCPPLTAWYVKEVAMSAKIVLKNERGRFRYYLNDEKGNTLLSGPYIIQKDLALSYIEKLTKTDNLENHVQAQKGPDGSWVFRCELHASREGEKGNISDSLPLGFSGKFDEEAAMKKAMKEFTKSAKGAELVDET